VAALVCLGHARVSSAERLAVHVPFSIYLGWITVATVASLTIALYALPWNGQPLTPESWAIMMLIVGAAIAGAVLLTRRDIAYVLVIVSAFFSVAVKQSTVPSVALIAVAMAAAVLALVVRGLTRRCANGAPVA
jgi:hypothetical protein